MRRGGDLVVKHGNRFILVGKLHETCGHALELSFRKPNTRAATAVRDLMPVQVIRSPGGEVMKVVFRNQ